MPTQAEIEKKADEVFAGLKGLAFLGFVIVVGWQVLAANCSSSNKASGPTPTITPTAIPTKTALVQGNRAPSVGQEGRINVESESIFAATSEANYDAYDRALAANDRIGAFNLAAQGRLYLVDNGTKVLVLDRAGFLGSLMQVRILEGRYFGRALWLPSEFVNRL